MTFKIISTDVCEHILFPCVSPSDYLSILLTCKHYSKTLEKTNCFKYTKLCLVRDFDYILKHPYIPSESYVTTPEAKRVRDYVGRGKTPIRTVTPFDLRYLDVTMKKEMLKIFKFDLDDFRFEPWFEQEYKMIMQCILNFQHSPIPEYFRTFSLDSRRINSYSLIQNVSIHFRPQATMKDLADLVLKHKGEDLVRWKCYNDDKDMVISAIRNNFVALQFASDRLVDDLDVVKEAINSKHPNAFGYASTRLRRDKEATMYAISKNGLAIRYASRQFLEDRDIAMVAVQNNGEVLEFLPKQFRNDRDIVIAAIINYPSAIQYSIEFRKDPDLIIFALQRDEDASLFTTVPELLRKNRDFLLRAVSTNGRVLQYLSDGNRSDPELVLVAVKQNGMCLKYTSSKIQDDKDIVAVAIENEPMSLQYASRRLQYDQDFRKILKSRQSWYIPSSTIQSPKKRYYQIQQLLIKKRI
jgi:hypothetical protein